jgi:hypothetical protein
MIEDLGRHLSGGPHPGGEGKVPSLRSLLARKKYADVDDLVLALQNGETLGYEGLSSGGMAQVQESLARLPETDLRAISEYLSAWSRRAPLPGAIAAGVPSAP